MPRDGWKVIIISEDDYKLLQKVKEELGADSLGYAIHLLLVQYIQGKKEAPRNCVSQDGHILFLQRGFSLGRRSGKER